MTRKSLAVLEGKMVEVITLAAGSLTADILTLGATVWDLVLALPDGRRPLVLKHSDPLAYCVNPAYLGVTAGRYANRIAQGRFRLDEQEYRVDCNENGRQHLHGGTTGISRKNWSIIGASESSVTLELLSPDGDNGFPGTARLTCCYRLEAPATLVVEYSAVCDAVTIMNLAHHSYFTLTPGSDSRDHGLEVAADFFTPVDADLIPTGEIRTVTGTPFDFRAMRPLRQAPTHPYDVNFVLRKPVGEFGPAARLTGPDGRVTCTLWTDAPGLQVYDGHGLPAPHSPYGGIALEPQFFPDSPNQPHFPSARLAPGSTYRQRTEYRFSI